MRTLYVFILGASLSCNAMLFYTWQSATPMPGSKVASFLNAQNWADPGTYHNEVIETMKTNRILNTIAFAAAMSIGAPILAAEPSAAVEGAYRSLEADNIKNTAGAGAQGLAVINSATANTQSIMMQNAASNQQAMNQIAATNQQAMNQIQAKMVAQTTIVGATEGSKAMETVTEAGDAATMATLMTMFNAILQAQKVNAQ